MYALLKAPMPYVLAGLSSFSAIWYFAADTIFIDLVIFSMFVTDFNLIDTANGKITSIVGTKNWQLLLGLPR